MKVNIKNSSSIESNKLEIITNFIGFCHQNSPIKKVVEVVLVDFTSDEFFNGKFYFVVKNKSVLKKSDLLAARRAATQLAPLSLFILFYTIYDRSTIKLKIENNNIVTKY